MTPFAQRLMQLRLHAGLTPKQLSILAGLSKTLVRTLEEKDRPSPAATTAVKLARTLGTTAEWLVEGDGPGPTPAGVREAVARARAADPKSQAA
jgi:transcriptional regulator with XRE-family HTH domain